MEQGYDRPSGKFTEFVGQETPTPPSKRTMNWKKLFFGLLGIIFLCICLFAIVISRARMVIIEQEPFIQRVITEFMEAGERKDVDAAYAMFSPRAQKITPREQITTFIQGKTHVLFEDFESITITKLVISKTANIDPNAPQGTVATVEGVVHYQGGVEGNFRAILEKVDDEWRIYGINITIPPEKFP